jgi:hypothetical protein
VGFVVDTGADFLLVLRFPLSIIPPDTPQSSSIIILGWYNGPVMTSVMVDLGPVHPKKKKEVKFSLYLLNKVLHHEKLRVCMYISTFLEPSPK